MPIQHTARNSGYYYVYINNVLISGHITEREALEVATNVAEENPGDIVTTIHDYQVTTIYSEPIPQEPIVEIFEGVPGNNGVFDPNATLLFQPWNATAVETANSTNRDSIIAEVQGTKPWISGKGENFTQNQGGRIYFFNEDLSTFTTNTGEANIPSINSDPRVGRLHIRADLAQTDAYLSRNDYPSEFLPGDVWFQQWVYLHGNDSNFTERTMKFYYPCHSASFGSCQTHKWLFELQKRDNMSNPSKLVTDGVFVCLRDQGNSSGARFDWNDNPAGITNQLGHNLDQNTYIKYNQWWLLKARMKTDQLTNDNRFECWLRPYGTPTFTKVSEFISGSTPSNFVWDITSGFEGGHTSLILISSVPGNNATGLESNVYMKDLCITDAESKLPVYTSY